MSMLDWAREEIRIAEGRENPNWKRRTKIQAFFDKLLKRDNFDYGCTCYESALKAFESLCGDGHSGFSIGMTKHILVSLIDGRPLTPIQDSDDEWQENYFTREKTGAKVFQGKRMSSLFKEVLPDGTVSYDDIDRTYCKDIVNGSTYSSGFWRNLVDEMYPITLPYAGHEIPIVSYVDDCQFDPKNGDYDTIGCYYIIDSEGNKVTVNKFFKENEKDWIEITEEEFNDRKKVQKEREEKTKLMADMLFDDKVSAIHSANPNISKQQASCYVVNFCNDYICKEHNGGCRGFEICSEIHKKEK